MSFHFLPQGGLDIFKRIDKICKPYPVCLCSEAGFTVRIPAAYGI